MVKKILFLLLILPSCFIFSIDYSNWTLSSNNLSLPGETISAPQIAINESTGVAICSYLIGTGPHTLKAAYSTDKGANWVNVTTPIATNISYINVCNNLPKIQFDSSENVAIIVWTESISGKDVILTSSLKSFF